MATFSVFTQDHDPAEPVVVPTVAMPKPAGFPRAYSEEPASAPLPLGPQTLGSPSLSSQSLGSQSLGIDAEETLPPVCLRLPEVVVAEIVTTAPAGFAWRSLIFWGVLALGALLALALILSGQKPAPAPSGAPPSWHAAEVSLGEASTGAPAAAGVSSIPAMPNANSGSSAVGAPPAWRVPASGNSQPAPATSPMAPAGDGPHMEMQTPADLTPDQGALPGDHTSLGQPSAETVHTARAGDTRWDGARVKPSEAAPLGISNSEPQ